MAAGLAPTRRSATLHVTLFAPGLFELPAADPPEALAGGLRLPGLERLLARAERVQGPGGGVEAALFRLFGLEPPVDSDPPVAAVARLAEPAGSDSGAPAGGPAPERRGEGTGTWWLRADPVHLRPDLSQLVLFDAGSFSLPAAEAEALAGQVAPLFAEAGATLEAAAPGRWYLRLGEPLDLRASTLSAVAGQDLRRHRPRGADARRWQALLTEVQMTLFASPTNLKREARGEPPVNSLWLWGAGARPEPPAPRWSAVWGGGELAAGLALLAGSPVQPTVDSFSDWVGRAARPGEHLLVDDRLLRAVRYGDVEAWRARLTALETSWVAPALEALGAGRAGSVALYDGAGRGLQLTRRGLRRWWRRPRPLAAVLAGQG